MEVLQARPHVVALWVGAHEPSQPFEPVAHQLRLAQLLGHRRNPLVCRPERGFFLLQRPKLGFFSFHRHLPISHRISFSTTASVRLPWPLRCTRGRGITSRTGALCVVYRSYTLEGDQEHPVTRA